VCKYNNNITNGIFIGIIKRANFEFIGFYEALQQILNFTNHLFVYWINKSFQEIFYILCVVCGDGCVYVRTYTHARAHPTHTHTHTHVHFVYRVFKNDGSKIRGVIGDAKISEKCQKG